VHGRSTCRSTSIVDLSVGAQPRQRLDDSPLCPLQISGRRVKAGETLNQQSDVTERRDWNRGEAVSVRVEQVDE
jgi:hypothetical protein